ncbi:MAG: PhzA/PhzB family protein [Pelobium sp.]
MEKNQGDHIMQDLLAAFNQNTETVLNLFTPQATVEYPYAKTLGIPDLLTMDDYENHLNNILGQMPDIIFTNLKVDELKEKDCYWGEFSGKTTVPDSGLIYEQDYVVNFKLENGKFSFYREFWNVLPVLQVLMSKEDAHQIIDNSLNN